MQPFFIAFTLDTLGIFVSMYTEFDRVMMRRALALAAKGKGYASPNPLVGCVVVREGEVIGEGYHARYGEPHAEANAIANAEANGRIVEGADLYVTLEPCAHFGKRPPCADLLIAKRIRSCTIALRDPYPEVDGKGIDKLQAAGIEVRLGLLEDSAREQNRFFIKRVTTGLPYVTLKIAQSIDGRSALATGESKWITGEYSRKRVHELRAEYDAVLVGSGTVLADDPELTVRLAEGRHPTRVVLDRENKLPATHKAFDEQAPHIRVVGPGMKRLDFDLEVAMSGDHLSLKELLPALSERGISSVLIEAGSKLAASVMTDDIADELLFFTAPVLLGGDAQPSVGILGLTSLSSAARWTLRSAELFEGGDILTTYRRSLT
jgi:diaminohydroxyphosphoribosylaminopyrimidine deaminase/5-amino-6-(5-phosphoribosylamino)uracil reductase